MMLAYTLSFIDRKLPFILAESIKHDLQLSDTQLGLLTGGMFATVYAIAGIPLARLSDRSNRKNIISVAIVVWCGLTAMGGFARNFWQLALCRMGVAVGEAGCTPAAHSIIGSYFPPRYRSTAMGLYFVGAQLGILLGLALGGVINDLADWRTAMFVLGAPGVLMAALVFFTVREPPRPPSPVVRDAAPEGVVAGVSIILRQKTVLHLLVAAMLFSIAGGGFQAFAPSYVIRTFDLSTSYVGVTYGAAMGLAGISGSILGGYLGDKLMRSEGGLWKSLMVMGVIVAVGSPFKFWAFFVDSYAMFLALIFITQATTMTYGGPCIAALQSLTPPRLHALASALYLVFATGMGNLIGPVFTGAMSDYLATQGVQNTLRYSVGIVLLPLVWGAAHFALAGKSLRARDLSAAKAAPAAT